MPLLGGFHLWVPQIRGKEEEKAKDKRLLYKSNSQQSCRERCQRLKASKETLRYMSKEELVYSLVVVPTLEWMGGKFNTPIAQKHLLAIGLQESRLTYREQIGGPAHGFWQFESGGGVKGVINHPSSKEKIKEICEGLNYRVDRDVLYAKIIDNDVLACAMARLLLYTVPKPLTNDREEAWKCYIEAWRPGKPHPQTWAEMWERAGRVVGI